MQQNTTGDNWAITVDVPEIATRKPKKRGPYLKTVCNWPFRKRLKFAWDIWAKYKNTEL